MIVYNMRRGGSTVAQVVTLDSGKCVVSWPTSVIVYDSEQAARAVHITHMGGRGEETTFWPEWSSRSDFMRGVENAHLDANENAPWAVLIGGRGPSAKLRCPDWDTLTDREAFVDGYLAAASYLFTPREDMTVEIGGADA